MDWRRQRRPEEEKWPSTLSTSECFGLLLVVLVVLVFFGGELGRQLLNTSKTLPLTTATYRKS